MTLFDEIVEAGNIGNGNNRESTLSAQDIATTQSAMHRRSAKNIPFRGLLVDVSDATNGEVARRSKLDFTVETHPAGAIIGAGQVGLATIKAAGYQCIVRRDTTEALSITSTKFKVHQTTEILHDIKEMADIGGAHICYAGPLDGGRKVVCVARLIGEFELPSERGSSTRMTNDHSGAAADKTLLFAVISGGHEVGTPFTITGLAYREWCANGAAFTAKSGCSYRRTHRQSLDGKTREDISNAFVRMREEFARYGRSAQRLQHCRMDRDQARLYVAELINPGFSQEFGTRLTGIQTDDDKVWVHAAETMRGRQLLNTMLREKAENEGMARTGKQLLDAIMGDQGESRNGDNLWTGYNGVTYQVNHLRGRTAESGVDAALFGAGAQLQERALATALRFSGEVN